MTDQMMTHKANPVRDESSGELEGYDYRGEYICRDYETTAGGGRFHVAVMTLMGALPTNRQFPTLREARDYIDRTAT